MNTILNEVQISLGPSSLEKGELLNSLIKRSNKQVINYLKVKELPDEFEYIVIELTIARYNRIGSEGLNSENADGVSFSYNNDLLKAYKYDLDRWIIENQPKKNNVRMRLI